MKLSALQNRSNLLRLLIALGAAATPTFGSGRAARGEADREYKIKIQRPSKAGDEYTISTTGKSKSVLSLGGAPQQESFTVELEGTVHILAVNKAGGATRLECTVEKCVKDDQSLFDKGTVITAEKKDGKSTYAVKGTAVEPGAVQALEIVLRVTSPDEIDDDAIFGTDQPQKVGATWPVNAAAAAENLSKSAGIEVKPEQIKGTTRLVEVKQEQGKDVLTVEADMSFKDGKGKVAGGGQQIEHANADVHVSGRLPADPAGKALGQELSMKTKFQVKARTPDGQDVTVDVTAEQSSTATFGEVKK